MKPINLKSDDSLEKIEEEIIEAADKAGKKNVIVNIFSYPREKLKRRWQVRYKFNKKHLVMDALIAAAVLVLIGLNIFWLYGGFHYFVDKLDLKINGRQDGYLSGGQAVFEVEYNNKNNYKLEEAVLGLNLPADFQLKKVSRDGYDYGHNILNLGDLAPGANGSFQIEGQIIGALNQKQTLAVNLNYYKTDKKGERLWGQFNKNIVYQYEITDSYIKIEASLPEKLVNGQAGNFPLKLTNAGDISFDRIKIVGGADILQFPFGPNKEININIPLKVKTEEKTLPVRLEVFWVREGRDLLQAIWQKDQPVISPNFTVKQKVSDSAVNPGDSVEITILYNNAGTFTIENAVIELELSGSYWEKQKDFNPISGNKIVWTFKDWPRLALIQPKEQGDIKISVGTHGYIQGGSDLSLRSAVNVSYRLAGQTVEIFGESAETKLNSDLNVLAYPVYFTATGDQLGRGPLPPAVAQETKYWLFIKLINDIHDVDGVKVTAKLPINVSWNDKTNVPVGDPVQFDASTKTLSWQISRVPVQPNNIGFAFEVGIIPTASQKGTYPVLLDDLIVKGVDSVTGEAIEKNLGVITTRLLYDKKGKAKDGTVK